MLVDDGIALDSGLQRAVEREVVQQTNGRLRGIHVTAAEGCLTVRGWAPTYHVKQLAIHALLDVVDRGEWKLVVDIDVL